MRQSIQLNLANRSKIRLYGVHMGYIDEGFIDDFKQTCRVKQFSGWIKKTSHLELGLYLENKDDVRLLLRYLEQHHYRNGAEWIQECMRKAMYPTIEVDWDVFEQASLDA